MNTRCTSLRIGEVPSAAEGSAGILRKEGGRWPSGVYKECVRIIVGSHGKHAEWVNCLSAGREKRVMRQQGQNIQRREV